MGRLGFAVESVVCGAVDDVDVEPAVVIVVEQGNAGANGFKDVGLLGRAHLVGPLGQAGFFRDVLEDDRAGLDEAAGGDGAVFGVEDRGKDAAGGRSALLRGRSGGGAAAIKGRLGRWRLRFRRPGDGDTKKRKEGYRRTKGETDPAGTNQSATSGAGNSPEHEFCTRRTTVVYGLADEERIVLLVGAAGRRWRWSFAM